MPGPASRKWMMGIAGMLLLPGAATVPDNAVRAAETAVAAATPIPAGGAPMPLSNAGTLDPDARGGTRYSASYAPGYPGHVHNDTQANELPIAGRSPLRESVTGAWGSGGYGSSGRSGDADVGAHMKPVAGRSALRVSVGSVLSNPANCNAGQCEPRNAYRVNPPQVSTGGYALRGGCSGPATGRSASPCVSCARGTPGQCAYRGGARPNETLPVVYSPGPAAAPTAQPVAPAPAAPVEQPPEGTGEVAGDTASRLGAAPAGDGSTDPVPGEVVAFSPSRAPGETSYGSIPGAGPEADAAAQRQVAELAVYPAADPSYNRPGMNLDAGSAADTGSQIAIAPGRYGAVGNDGQPLMLGEVPYGHYENVAIRADSRQKAASSNRTDLRIDAGTGAPSAQRPVDVCDPQPAGVAGGGDTVNVASRQKANSSNKTSVRIDAGSGNAPSAAPVGDYCPAASVPAGYADGNAAQASTNQRSASANRTDVRIDAGRAGASPFAGNDYGPVHAQPAPAPVVDSGRVATNQRSTANNKTDVRIDASSATPRGGVRAAAPGQPAAAGRAGPWAGQDVRVRSNSSAKSSNNTSIRINAPSGYVPAVSVSSSSSADSGSMMGGGGEVSSQAPARSANNTTIQIPAMTPNGAPGYGPGALPEVIEAPVSYSFPTPSAGPVNTASDGKAGSTTRIRIDAPAPTAVGQPTAAQGFYVQAPALQGVAGPGGTGVDSNGNARNNTRVEIGGNAPAAHPVYVAQPAATVVPIQPGTPANGGYASAPGVNVNSHANARNNTKVRVGSPPTPVYAPASAAPAPYADGQGYAPNAHPAPGGSASARSHADNASRVGVDGGYAGPTVGGIPGITGAFDAGAPISPPPMPPVTAMPPVEAPAAPFPYSFDGTSSTTPGLTGNAPAPAAPLTGFQPFDPALDPATSAPNAPTGLGGKENITVLPIVSEPVNGNPEALPGSPETGTPRLGGPAGEGIPNSGLMPPANPELQRVPGLTPENRVPSALTNPAEGAPLSQAPADALLPENAGLRPWGQTRTAGMPAQDPAGREAAAAGWLAAAPGWNAPDPWRDARFADLAPALNPLDIPAGQADVSGAAPAPVPLPAPVPAPGQGATQPGPVHGQPHAVQGGYPVSAPAYPAANHGMPYGANSAAMANPYAAYNGQGVVASSPAQSTATAAVPTFAGGPVHVKSAAKTTSKANIKVAGNNPGQGFAGSSPFSRPDPESVKAKTAAKTAASTNVSAPGGQPYPGMEGQPPYAGGYPNPNPNAVPYSRGGAYPAFNAGGAGYGAHPGYYPPSVQPAQPAVAPWPMAAVPPTASGYFPALPAEAPLPLVMINDVPYRPAGLPTGIGTVAPPPPQGNWVWLAAPPAPPVAPPMTAPTPSAPFMVPVMPLAQGMAPGMAGFGYGAPGVWVVQPPPGTPTVPAGRWLMVNGVIYEAMTDPEAKKEAKPSRDEVDALIAGRAGKTEGVDAGGEPLPPAVKAYQKALEKRLLEKYDNLPDFSGKIGAVKTVVPKPPRRSLDGKYLQAWFDVTVYDTWGKRLPQLEKEHYVVTFGPNGAETVRADPSIRVGLDLEGVYSERD